MTYINTIHYTILVLLYVWPQFTNPKLRANSLRPLVGKPTYFMVAWTSLIVEPVVHATIKFAMPALEVGPEFALNSKVC